MAVDVALATVSVEPRDTFWDVATRFGAAVTREVQQRRTLGSWFRTERRSMDLPLAGVPIPLISNIGRVAAATQYGALELLALHACMSTHNMFHMAMLVQTFREAAHLCYYHELPTVSRASMHEHRRASLPLTQNSRRTQNLRWVAADFTRLWEII